MTRLTRDTTSAGSAGQNTTDILNAQIGEVPRINGKAGQDRAFGAFDLEITRATLTNAKRPSHWDMVPFSSLKSLVAQFKGAASKPVLDFINRHLKGTKLIFVVGQTGTGKSTLLSEITGQDLGIGKGIASGTKQYEIVPGIVHGEQYLFIDTAGFGAFDIGDMDNFHDIITGIDALGPFVTIVGALLVCNSAEERLKKEELSTIQWLKCFCGPDFYRHITVVMNKWDKLGQDDFEERWDHRDTFLSHEGVRDILDPTPVGSRRYHGGTVYHHGLDLDTLGANNYPKQLSKRRHPAERAERVHAMIKDRYGGERSTVKLQVLREMADEVEWNETEAAKVIKSPDLKFILRIRDDFVRVSVPMDPRFTDQRRPAIEGNTEKPPEPAWWERVLGVLEVAYQAAVFFNRAQQAPRREPGANGPVPPERNAWIMIVERVRAWWNGGDQQEEDEEDGISEFDSELMHTGDGSDKDE